MKSRNTAFVVSVETENMSCCILPPHDNLLCDCLCEHSLIVRCDSKSKPHGCKSGYKFTINSRSLCMKFIS